ncbi:hypothetical protein C499_11846 [Halogeometricum borinquense DSM 11551]|uniref:Uncharacterized protein n=1 Tax=Halogeometricum borinquense (strain ATCC 700274 / DSM 11551 / JCM 10706 / KCTC 4070 / PR3) TaxID=469382 RepID=E4NTF0_HALBP|nr:hypothetical protein [Halogeometricum borinquense]ADQ65895.1 hypothetical protein Hbor_02850 [Halogeometricum borinquense DSM 11551]ELY26898.1 hypothetical protein C499_11846 [Halogeometricum borinquense DSM 11551]
MSQFGPEWHDAVDTVGAPDSSAAPFSASLAFGIAVVATFALGVAVGSPLGAVVTAVGASVVGWSAGELTSNENSRRAVGSISTLVGTSLLAVSIGLFGPEPFVGSVAAFALVAVAFDRFAGLTEDTVGVVSRAIIHSGVAIAGFAALALLVHFHVASTAALTTYGLFSLLSRMSPLVSVLVIELEVLFIVLTIEPAIERLERLTPETRVLDRITALDVVAVDIAAVPRGVWILVAGTGYLTATSWARVMFEQFLDSLSMLGTAVAFLLQSGFITGPLGFVVALLLAVFAVNMARLVVMFWLGSDPSETLSLAAGGFVVGSVAFVGGLIPSLSSIVSTTFSEGPLLQIMARVYGTGATLLAVVVGLLFVVLLILAVIVYLVEHEFVPPAAGGFALGSGLLFIAGLLVAATDAAAIVTVATVGAALLVWDLGENAVDVGQTLGTDAETRRGEAVHAAGSIAVVTGAVVLAAISLYVLGPLSVPAGRARFALLLLVVALCGFAVATYNE